MVCMVARPGPDGGLAAGQPVPRPCHCGLAPPAPPGRGPGPSLTTSSWHWQLELEPPARAVTACKPASADSELEWLTRKDRRGRRPYSESGASLPAESESLRLHETVKIQNGSRPGLQVPSQVPRARAWHGRIVRHRAAAAVARFRPVFPDGAEPSDSAAQASARARAVRARVA